MDIAPARAARTLHPAERTWYGGSRQVVDQQAAATCFLDRINPTPTPPTTTR